MFPRARYLLYGLLCVVLGHPVVQASPVPVRMAGRVAHSRLAMETGWAPAQTPGCTYSLSKATASVPSTGTTAGSFSVVTGTSCSWTAVSNVSWITVTRSSGSGIGTITYTVAANATGSVRVGVITVAGLTHTVTQVANSCTYSISETAVSVPSTGTTGGAFAIVTGTACSWTAVSNVSWITVTRGTGSGIGTITYTVAANTTGSVRVGVITVAGLTHTVTQAANSCTYSISETAVSVPSTGTTGGAFAIVTGTACSWTAVKNVSWITITNGTGSGMGTITYTVAANTTGSSRTGIITVAGLTHTVTQAATSCTYSLGATSASVPSAGTTAGSVSVVTGTSCSWTAVSSAAWITVTSGASGTGIGVVNYSVAPNPTASQRVGTITIAGITYTVTQAAGTTAPAPPQNVRIVQ